MRLTRSLRAVLLLVLGGFIPLLIFGDLAEDVWKQSGFPFDVPLLLAIHSTAQPKLDVFVSYLTKLGVFWGVFPAAAIIVLFLLIRQRWRAIEFLLTALVGSIIINQTVKRLLHRARPHLWVTCSRI
ncbi:MAG: hypothetical protein V7K94_30055 [Nostoc sp.]|uniref:hypothetical protein n=1 Tax=Nostoc sp. TaxID=1180 RepID=UPI002FFCD4B1